MSTYTEAVERCLDGIEHVSPGIGSDCPVCQRDYGYDDNARFAADIESGTVCDEGGFSWSQCDACGSQLGGNRYDAHGLILDAHNKPAGELVHLGICVDCLCYLANGDEPESTE